jgi:hypothetical protein
VKNIVFDSDGNYIGVKDFQNQFRQLWQTSAG